MRSINLNSSKMPMPIEAWVFVFFTLYVSVTGLMLQIVVLPLTPWHAGDGLMVGGDWIFFHDVALNHAARIREFGWSVAQLRPDGQGPSGVAAFVYAITGVSKPWVLLPIHGAVYALAAVGLFWVLQGLSGSNRLGLFGLVPMCLMPSLAMIWGQLHKDVWATAAILLLLGMWLRLFIGRPLTVWTSLMVLVFANLSLWWMRPYALQIVLVGQTFLFLLLFPLSLFLRLLRPLIIGFFALTLTYTVFVFNNTYFEAASQVKDEIVSDTCKDWKMTLSSARLDYTLMGIACTRDRLMRHSPNAKSNLDPDVSFSSAKDVLAYLPRAAQVGIFAPFPKMWFAEGTSEASRLFRLIAAAETSVVYVALLGVTLLLVFVASGQIRIGLERSAALFALLGFSFVWVVIYAIALGNIGSIYRVRFPIVLLWMGIGLWSWSKILFLWRKKIKR